MNNPQPSYIPPGAPPRRGPSCWLVGALTCLGIVILVVIGFVALGLGFLHSKTGKSIMGSAMALPQCETNMKTIHDAIMRYHEHTGSYPNSLTDLSPTYLTNAEILHCDLDTNKDPSHVSYVYTKPTSASTDSSKLLTMDWLMTIDMGQQTQTTDTTIVMTLGGEIQQSQSHSDSTSTTTTSGGVTP